MSDHLSDYDFNYPEELVGLRPQQPSRVLFNKAGRNSELTLEQSLELFEPGDVLVVNNTKVLPRRIMGSAEQSGAKLEILFLETTSEMEWKVLFPAKKLKSGESVQLPQGITFELVERGLPQTIRLSSQISDAYFADHGELALPPYIEKARSTSQEDFTSSDHDWYQTAWAKHSGSCAAPTASLHFSESHIDQLREYGVQICELTLHVGLGTFLPVKSDNLNKHEMHKEWVEIPRETLDTLKSKKGRVFALGTTVARSLEAYKLNHFEPFSGGVHGSTDLFIKPGFEYQVVDVLMTNFHQPKSTLLALVSAYAGLENVKSSYKWAIDKQFKLFSYGDLSIWMN